MQRITTIDGRVFLIAAPISHRSRRIEGTPLGGGASVTLFYDPPRGVWRVATC